MSSSNQKNGELHPIEFTAQQQDSSSLNRILHTEHWLLDMGLITQISQDTLWGYASVQPYVDANKTKVIIDVDDKGNIKKPLVKYEITLNKKMAKKYSRIRAAEVQGGFWGKIKFIWHAMTIRFFRITFKRGALIPGVIENDITSLSKNYLPPKYQVEVEVK